MSLLYLGFSARLYAGRRPAAADAAARAEASRSILCAQYASETVLQNRNIEVDQQAGAAASQGQIRL
jgi:hypothetical protein